MKYILICASLFAATPALATLDSDQRRCRDAIITTAFFKKAPEPVEIVNEYLEHMGARAEALVGPESIRHRLDRAFFRYLLQRFAVPELGVTTGDEFDLNDQMFRITTTTAKELVVHDVATNAKIIDWSARHGYGEPTARRALDIDEPGERADTWLDMHPEIGVALLAAVIEKYLPPERRIELRTEIDVWERYVEELRAAFNRSPAPAVRLNPNFRAQPRAEHTLH